jgi:PAS domain S-box-containing protein
VTRQDDSELAELRSRLKEVEASLQAIRSGAADALFDGNDVLHLGGAAKPYVTFFSAMNEGGVTLDRHGAILHSNSRFAAMLGKPIDDLRGRPFAAFVAAADRERAARLLHSATTATCEVGLEAAPGDVLPVRLSLTAVDAGGQRFGCLVVTELRERVESERELKESMDRLVAAESQLRRQERDLRTIYAHQQTVIEVERKHVAREVHDEMGQILTALRMELSLLQRELPEDAKAAARVDEMFQLIEALFKSVRSIAGSLRPPTLDLGLVPAIEWLAQDFEKRWNIECALDMGVRDLRVDEAFATTVFRIIQESLTNVARHAEASSVSISLDRLPDGVRLEIQDNGRGFDPAAVDAGRFGLLGMRERVQELGGSLALRASPASGTLILIDLPCPGA